MGTFTPCVQESVKARAKVWGGVRAFLWKGLRINACDLSLLAKCPSEIFCFNLGALGKDCVQ